MRSGRVMSDILTSAAASPGVSATTPGVVAGAAITHPRSTFNHSHVIAMLQRTLEPEYMDTKQEADAYAAMDHAAPNAAFVDRLKELGACGRVLDLGSGPGDIPILICQQLPRAHVTAIDAAQQMLRIAKRRVDEAMLTGRIAIECADVKRLPYADASFDTVCSNTILHHLPEPGRMLQEAVRVLKPGGCLLIRDLMRPDEEAQVQALVQTHAADQNEHQRKLLADSLRAALTPDELGELMMPLDLEGWQIVIDTDRHMSLQRPAR